jgi:hypothetical protein
MDNDRAEILRRRVDAYRCYLAVGGDIETVRIVLNEVAACEVELAAIERRSDKLDEGTTRECQKA